MEPCGIPHLVIFHEAVFTTSPNSFERLSQGFPKVTSVTLLMQDNKDLELDIIPASLSDREVKLRDANHEVNEEKRKSARKKEYVGEDREKGRGGGGAPSAASRHLLNFLCYPSLVAA